MKSTGTNFQEHGDVQSCSNHRVIKLMSHNMRLWERVVKARSRREVMTSGQQHGFIQRKSTTDVIFGLNGEDHKELQCVFVDLEKAHDGVLYEEVRHDREACEGGAGHDM